MDIPKLQHLLRPPEKRPLDNSVCSSEQRKKDLERANLTLLSVRLLLDQRAKK